MSSLKNQSESRFPMGGKILVSVIVPAYNHEKYVRETLISILSQTHKYHRTNSDQ